MTSVKTLIKLLLSENKTNLKKLNVFNNIRNTMYYDLHTVMSCWFFIYQWNFMELFFFAMALCFYCMVWWMTQIQGVEMFNTCILSLISFVWIISYSYNVLVLLNESWFCHFIQKTYNQWRSCTNLCTLEPSSYFRSHLNNVHQFDDIQARKDCNLNKCSCTCVHKIQ